MTEPQHRTIWQRKDPSERSKAAHDLYAARAALYELMIMAVGHRRSLRRYFETRPYVRDGMRVLDAGCGSGALIDVLHSIVDRRKFAAEFHGFDLTPEMLKAARRRSARRTCHKVFLMPADVRDVPEALPDEWTGADLVVSAGMFEYLDKEELPDVLRRLGSMLKPGGTLAFFISREGRANRLALGKAWKANLFTEAEVRAIVDASGLRLASLTPFRTWGFAVEAERPAS
jgi:cyclopropane fatty-acyl-phospholipid synthase-like methyltransferase